METCATLQLSVALRVGAHARACKASTDAVGHPQRELATFLLQMCLVMRRRVGAPGCPENVNGKVFLAQLWKGFIHCTHCVLNPITLFNVQSQSGKLEKSLAGAYAFSPNGSSLPVKEGAGQLRVLTCTRPTRSALWSLTYQRTILQPFLSANSLITRFCVTILAGSCISEL